MLVSQEEKMPDDSGFHDPDEDASYTFLGTSPAETFRELVVLHLKEAKQLRERAREAEEEGRTEEVKLLLDVAVTREKRAAELELAAKGEADDPSVAEVLDGEKEILVGYEAPTMSFIKPEDLPPATLPAHMRPLPPSNFDRAMDWIKNRFKKK
jgi:hypothetical protein